MRLGDWEWDSVDTGRFKLDGGAMFGNVPKVLWQKSFPADENNRIPMALRCLLLKKDDRVILVDTGMGHKWTDKQLQMYQLDYSQFTLEKSLSDMGLDYGDITDVILTHLHFDHAGGATYDDNGTIKPRFPNAVYHIQEDNLKTANNPNSRERASYLDVNWQSLFENSQVNLLKGPSVLFGDLQTHMSDGHTLGMQTITISDQAGATLSYCADLIPLHTHVNPAYTMGYDIHAVKVLEEKKYFLEEVVGDNGILFFEHDPFMAAAHLDHDERGRFKAGEVVLEA